MRLIRTAVACILPILLLGLTSQEGVRRERNGKGDELKDVLEGQAPPQLMGTWFNIQGKSLTWDELKGKVIVLDFWTHWSLPSREAVPSVRKLLSKHSDKGLVVIAVHSDPNQAKMEQAIRQLGITWPVLLDAKKTNMRLYSADSFSDYYLIDRKGVLRFADIANEDLEKATEALLAETAEKG